MPDHAILGFAWTSFCFTQGLLASLKQLVLLVLGFPIRLGEGFNAVGWVFEFLSRHQYGDGEDLQAGIAARKISLLVPSRLTVS
jgi:hypothetical protein